jgi:glutathione S-transferase
MLILPSLKEIYSVGTTSSHLPSLIQPRVKPTIQVGLYQFAMTLALLIFHPHRLPAKIQAMLPNKSLAILYSFRRCPFAMRARSTLIASGIRVELREVDLRNKPGALLAASPKGSVPLLMTPEGKVINESWDIMLWALRQQDPQAWLGKDEYHLQTALQWVNENDNTFKHNLDQYKYPNRYPEQRQIVYRSAGEHFLQQLEQQLKITPFLLGAKFTLADAALLPFVRQFASVDSGWFATAPYPALRVWLNRYTTSDLFAKVMQKFPVWKQDDELVVFGA